MPDAAAQTTTKVVKPHNETEVWFEEKDETENLLVVVKDIGSPRQFCRDLFALELVLGNGGNTGINCLKRLDSHTMAGITVALSSIIQLKEVPPC